MENEQKPTGVALSDRVAALEEALTELMALLVKEQPDLRQKIVSSLTKSIRDNDAIEHEDDETPDREYVAKTSLGKALAFLRDEFKRIS